MNQYYVWRKTLISVKEDSEEHVVPAYVMHLPDSQRLIVAKRHPEDDRVLTRVAYRASVIREDQNDRVVIESFFGAPGWKEALHKAVTDIKQMAMANMDQSRKRYESFERLSYRMEFAFAAEPPELEESED